jgi:acetolactate synthase-1/2/3 large subunit
MRFSGLCKSLRVSVIPSRLRVKGTAVAYNAPVAIFTSARRAAFWRFDHRTKTLSYLETTTMTGLRHGGRVLADQLWIQGCRRVFCVPGESYLAVLDGLYDIPDIETVTCRHEGGAAMMAEAHGKLTGQPGICMVTRAPGATNAAAGVHIAHQDSTPMILLIGQVGRGLVDREAFQEVDFRRMFGPLAKWVAQIDDAARIPEYLSQAYSVCLSGRPGPVVLALPEDMLSDEVTVADCKPVVPGIARAAEEDLDRLVGLLSAAERPLIMVGGGGWSATASQQLQTFAETHDLPVCASFRCQDYFDNDHRCYVGHAGIGINPKLAQRIGDCDLLICVGARLGEMTSSGYALVDIPNPQMKLVHVHPGAEEIGRVYRPDLGINASGPSFVAGIGRRKLESTGHWGEWCRAARRDFEKSLELLPTPGSAQMEQIVGYLREHLAPATIICNGAGNYTAWVHRYYRYRGYRTQLAPTSGSMGYGLPAAIAAKLEHPDRTVVCFAGDGCFLMTGQELATVSALSLKIVIVVVNNEMYGTIRMHQERSYPGRVIATGLRNPDFAALAESHGIRGVRVQSNEAFMDAYSASEEAEGAVLIEVMTDPNALTPVATLDGA